VRFRFRAFGFHLLGSAVVLTLILGGLYLGWYRWPAWYLLDVLTVTAVMAGVDLALGPMLTFVIASPAKPRRALARDIGIIVAVQLVALIYAALVLWSGRPLYYTFSAERLEVVRAFEIEAVDAVLAAQHNPQFAPHWYSRPRWVWAELPSDATVANEIVQSAIGGGPDVVDMPRYFRNWEQGLPELRKQLKPVDKLPGLSRQEKALLAARLGALKVPANQANAMLMTGRSASLVAIFELRNLRMSALITTR
jgi:hypothetical protein